MRGFEAILAAASLMAAPMSPPKPPALVLAALRQADPAMLDRDAVGTERAAMVVSLWPPTRQCLVPPVFQERARPAEFGQVNRHMAALGDARALQTRLAAHFRPASAAEEKPARKPRLRRAA